MLVALAAMSLAGCGSATTSRRTWGGVLIGAGAVATGAGSIMTGAGAASGPRLLVLYGPGEEPPGWDPGGSMESPALFVTGLTLAALGLGSMLAGGLIAADTAEPEPRPPVVTAGLDPVSNEP